MCDYYQSVLSIAASLGSVLMSSSRRRDFLKQSAALLALGGTRPMSSEPQREKSSAEFSGSQAQRRKEHQELEAKLLAGLQSPTSEMTADEWTALRERILSRSPELRGEG